ncbi:hypothetical protein ABFT23_09625 [Nocardioides sp. C4-1]|uniref:hypothetical protein n=1 Tax=Nocardioides sp. C4-1 TaxID=3151851 RepID=UPI003264D9D8
MASRNAVIGSVSSVVVVAAAVGLLFAVRAVGADELDLPAEVDGFTAIDTVRASGTGTDDDVARRAAADDEDAEGWSEAFDGAAAAVRSYVDLDSGDTATLSAVAVAADMGVLVPTSGFPDPAELGLALPREERVVDGDVECVLTRVSPPVAGRDYQPDEATPDAVTCQRRSATLTVRVAGPVADPDRVVGVVDDLWDELR